MLCQTAVTSHAVIFDNKLPQASQLAVTFEPRTGIGFNNPSTVHR